MRAEEAEELLNAFMREFYRVDAGFVDTVRYCLAAVYPLIALAERERCAKEIDCGCDHRDAMLALVRAGDGNTGERWRLCGQSFCGAIEAENMRALGDGEKEP